MSVRNTITMFDDYVAKQFTFEEHYRAELSAYTGLPWATPNLIGYDDTTLTIYTQKLATAEQLTWWRPQNSLRKLLTRLHEAGVNHRDVHVGNVLCDPHRGPVLIDWEHHTRNVGLVSYDLYGPDKSGVPQPEGQRGGPMWWDAKHKRAIAVRWAP